MGASFSIQASREVSKFLNNVTQVNQQTCQFQQQASNSGQVIVITDSDISNARIGQSIQVSTDASCLIASDMQENIANILKATTVQDKVGEYGPLASWGTFETSWTLSDIKQNVTNNIYQICQATCSSSNITSNDNQYIYLKGDDASGAFIGQSIDSNANSSCSMNNYMKFSLYNLTALLAASKVSHEGAFGALGAIILIIGGLIVLMVVGLVVFLMIKKKGVDPACQPDPKTGLVDPVCKNGKLPSGATPTPKITVKPSTVPPKPVTPLPPKPVTTVPPKPVTTVAR